jgi:hypothetical protein
MRLARTYKDDRDTDISRANLRIWIEMLDICAVMGIFEARVQELQTSSRRALWCRNKKTENDNIVPNRAGILGPLRFL